MVTIRTAEPGDANTLLDLIDALADYEKLERPDAEARARLTRDAFATNPPLFRAYLAEDDNEGVVGYAIVVQTYSTFLAKPTLYLEDLFVHPRGRRLGAGAALLKHAASDALKGGCGRMEWVCLDWNLLAIDFYEKRGATQLKNWRFFRLDEQGMQDLTHPETVTSEQQNE